MNNFHLIFFLDDQNLGTETKKIGFLLVQFQNYWVFDISAITLIHAN